MPPVPSVSSIAATVLDAASSVYANPSESTYKGKISYPALNGRQNYVATEIVEYGSRHAGAESGAA